jgi:hypothetical protein
LSRKWYQSEQEGREKRGKERKEGNASGMSFTVKELRQFEKKEERRRNKKKLSTNQNPTPLLRL